MGRVVACLCNVHVVDAEVGVGVRKYGVVDLLDRHRPQRVFAVTLGVASTVSASSVARAGAVSRRGTGHAPCWRRPSSPGCRSA